MYSSFLTSGLYAYVSQQYNCNFDFTQLHRYLIKVRMVVMRGQILLFYFHFIVPHTTTSAVVKCADLSFLLPMSSFLKNLRSRRFFLISNV